MRMICRMQLTHRGDGPATHLVELVEAFGDKLLAVFEWGALNDGSRFVVLGVQLDPELLGTTDEPGVTHQYMLLVESAVPLDRLPVLSATSP